MLLPALLYCARFIHPTKTLPLHLSIPHTSPSQLPPVLPLCASPTAPTSPLPPSLCLRPCSFVDPADPSTIYLTQPVDESQRLGSAPKYAANYGQDEKYEDMGLRP